MKKKTMNQKNMNMTTNQKVIVAVILGVLVLSLYIKRNMFQSQKHTVQAQKATIDSLKTELDSVNAVNKALEDDVAALQYSMHQLDTVIKENEQQISNLKKRKHEKTAAVSKYSSNELIEFLSKRYKSSTTDSTSAQ